jgi:ribosomal protein S11
MFLKTIITRTIKKKTYVFLKKKYLFFFFILWLKILKRNYYLLKYINIINLISFTIDIFTQIYKKYNLFFYIQQINTEKNIKFDNINYKNFNLISYIIKITLLKSNIFINITDIKGTIFTTCSSGKINIKGSQKTKKLAFNRIIKFTKFKIRKLKNKIFALHFTGIKFNRKKLINSLKKKFFIKNVKYFNLIAHNGCRLKK